MSSLPFPKTPQNLNILDTIWKTAWILKKHQNYWTIDRNLDGKSWAGDGGKLAM